MPRYISPYDAPIMSVRTMPRYISPYDARYISPYNVLLYQSIRCAVISVHMMACYTSVVIIAIDIVELITGSWAHQ